MAAEGGLRGKGAAWRIDCPTCGRSIAVTWNKRTGDAYIRTHNTIAPPWGGLRCDQSTKRVDRDQTYPGSPR